MVQRQHVVFVFGTLKRKEPNHRVMDDIKATFIGTGRTALKQRLSLDERYGIPYLFMPTEKEEGHHVHGEVYLCDDAAMAFLDHFEGVPKMYEREQVSVLLEAPVTLREPSRLRMETGGVVNMCDGAAVDSLRQVLRDEEGLTDTIDLIDTLEQRMKAAQQPTHDASRDSESSPTPTPTPCITPPPMETGPATVTLLLRIVANVYVCSRLNPQRGVIEKQEMIACYHDDGSYVKPDERRG
ncbi:unnamed protein product [Vitrella brassicaformis CCMP3155]|uniref:Gamma-glutamylcyclotransferase family protein n=1 Tax=Vitrella brassicaformis (strain CCMP3155) TaxID=1169540 RepID=A0A0G4FSI5_VITBC|nr:unnamed protein product [Vitrella brassicaformis CCMP3155]|mmetsp:Transcript_4775/g.11047  ORF Transcript_4775/g.11047 Transcript_4775/m.11047 type:complete len:240 (-) Transcript_4775:180-899(-)|eukprot:CEM17672.1 unnamed protein product [Vitrella brassicaformis CCMP3155]